MQIMLFICMSPTHRLPGMCVLLLVVTTQLQRYKDIWKTAVQDVSPPWKTSPSLWNLN